MNIETAELSVVDVHSTTVLRTMGINPRAQSPEEIYSHFVDFVESREFRFDW